MDQPEFRAEIVTMLATATGIGYTEESLLLAGARVSNLERLFNLRGGLTREDDTLPKRILKERCLKGAAKGQVKGDLCYPVIAGPYTDTECKRNDVVIIDGKY